MMNSRQYNRYVARLSPKSKVWKNVCFAFLIGGAICTLGQLLLVAFGAVGLDKDTAGTATSCALVFLSALTTGLSWYDDLAKLGGAGTLVASLASLITFREYTKHVKGQTGRFMVLFSAISFGFLGVLLVAMTLWMR